MSPEKQKIYEQLQTLNITDIQAFVLANPLKLTSEQLVWSANQLHFKEKLAGKVPSWNSVKGIISPAAISIEQSSSEQTAKFKANLFTGNNCLDLTGGMGVDSSFFASTFKHVTYVEQNADLVDVARHNFNELVIKNIELVNKTAEDYLSNTTKQYDLVYLDPARRNEQGGKVFFIKDCSPDVADLLPQLFKISDNVLVKYAPMLDIKAALRALKYVYKVIIVAVENDVKEALYLLKKNTGLPEIEAVNFSKNGKQEFASTFESEAKSSVKLSEPGKYLYEPNAAIMKAGLFKSLAVKLQLFKLSTNSHLYTNNVLCSPFPGRKFKVEKVIQFDKKTLRKELKGTYANVSCRNFPQKPDVLKKAFGFKDGGDKYIFFTQNEFGKKIVIFTSKISDV